MNWIPFLRNGKNTPDCKHGGDERYLRKHWYKITTKCGKTMKIFFERQAESRAKKKKDGGWIRSVEKTEYPISLEPFR
jgi:5-methylcytosine-specific restriction endonuclease McrBC GTP-binding regulatory subunit McrB